MKRRILFLAPLLLGTTESDGLSYARFGQTVYVDGPQITPIRLLEDSRCPIEARCVWAGQVRITVRVPIGGGRTQIRELTLNKPIHVADGALELVKVLPPRSNQRTIRRRDYRFAFRFSGGL